MHEKNSRQISLIVSASIIILCLIGYWFVIRPQQQYYNAQHININGVYLIKPIKINNFELTTNHGKRFTKENLKNHWTFLYFGFTHCSTVCPVTLGALDKMYQLLQKNLQIKDLPQVVFISVDPEQDSVEVLNNYINLFNTNFIGARASVENTIALEKQLHITAKKTDQYSIDHSAEILLVNPEANIQAYFSYPAQPEQMAKDYHSILRK